MPIKALCPICHTPRDGDKGQYSHGSVTCIRVLKDALRDLLPYVKERRIDISKTSAYWVIKAAEKALGEGTDGN